MLNSPETTPGVITEIPRKFRWKTLSRKLKVAYLAVWILSIVAIFIGFTTQTIFSALTAAVILHVFCVPFILKWPHAKSWAILGIILSPPVSFAIIQLMLLAPMSDTIDTARREQNNIPNYYEEIARDSNLFFNNFKAGDVSIVSDKHPLSDAFSHWKNDRLAYQSLRWISKLQMIVSGLDLKKTSISPLAEMLYADKIFILYDENLKNLKAEEHTQHLEGLLGKSRDEISEQERKDNPSSFHGVFMVQCMTKNDGEVLLATGIPEAWHTDLRAIPEAGPLIEACKAATLS